LAEKQSVLKKAVNAARNQKNVSQEFKTKLLKVKKAKDIRFEGSGMESLGGIFWRNKSSEEPVGRFEKRQWHFCTKNKSNLREPRTKKPEKMTRKPDTEKREEGF